MKKFMKRKLALFLAISILVPFLWNQNGTVASAAATPSLTKAKLDFTSIGEVFDININNKVAKSKYKWTTSDKKVATVNSKGLVTSVAAGAATIKCLITYPSKKTKSLSCKVTVVIPATAIEIKHEELKNNAYDLLIGSTIDLDAVLTPSNTTDTAYWYIDKDNILSDPDCITLDSANKGIVTGVKAGKAVVRVRAAKTATMDAASNSDIDDTIIFNVTAPTATVSYIDITSSNQITIKFDSPIKKDTVINSNNTLSSNIGVKLGKDTKNVLANDPGTLTASLSTDLRTLTITAANTLRGPYGVNVTKAVLTTDGVPVEEYFKEVNYIDTVAPDVANAVPDETGMIINIYFTEAMDFTNMKVSNAKCVTSTTYSATTLAILNNVLNYQISKDKRSLSINLSTMDPTDRGKVFTVAISGVKDLAGNLPVNSYVTAYLQTDSSQKPQAKPISVVRTGYSTLTATFDRAIKTGGSLQAAGNVIAGVVNSENNKQVNYTLPTYIANLTGINTVSIWGWDSYNVLVTDTSASNPQNFSVNFTTDNVPPVLTSYTYDTTSGILALTYTEKVALMNPTGTILAKLTATNGDVTSQNVNYTTVPDTEDNVVYLQLNLTVAGNYALSLYNGFVSDTFLNMAVSSTVGVSNTNTTQTELPAPTAINQSPTNLNQILIRFSNKLDIASAQKIENYKIPGIKINSAVLQENTTNGAVVVLTLPDGSVDLTLDRPIYISGVAGYNGSYAPITYYTGTVNLKENVKPALLSTAMDTTATSKNVIKLTFNEEVVGNLTASITQRYNNSDILLGCTAIANGKVVTLTLNSVPPVNSYLYITITANSLTDLSGNACQTILPQGVMVN